MCVFATFLLRFLGGCEAGVRKSRFGPSAACTPDGLKPTALPSSNVGLTYLTAGSDWAGGLCVVLKLEMATQMCVFATFLQRFCYVFATLLQRFWGGCQTGVRKSRFGPSASCTPDGLKTIALPNSNVGLTYLTAGSDWAGGLCVVLKLEMATQLSVFDSNVRF